MPLKITQKNLFDIVKRQLHSRRELQDAFIVACARTPLGSMGGSLKVTISKYTFVSDSNEIIGFDKDIYFIIKYDGFLECKSNPAWKHCNKSLS